MNDINKKEKIYYVSGMHCASCEVLIEKSVLDIKNVKSADASIKNKKLIISYEGDAPSIEFLNNLFRKERYGFFEKEQINAEQSESKSKLPVWLVLVLAGVLFFVLQKVGLNNIVRVDSNSSLSSFFVLGLLAGASTCAALVGGIVLSMSKQWSEIYDKSSSIAKKIEPHILFNIGRLISYGLLGGILGAIGGQLKFSITLSSIIAVAISILMIVLSMQMLGMKSLQKFQVTMPKFITRYVADEKKFKGKYMPAIMGAMTFFLPCGFTITAQGLALLSGSFFQGAMIMAMFALGTVPVLFLIGLGSLKILEKPHLSSTFLKIAGALVLIFALYNINAQLNVWGAFSVNDLRNNSRNTSNDSSSSVSGLPPIVSGKQIVKMNASANGYSPSYFKVRVGVPVRWEITDRGTSGCTNAIISRSLFSGSINLTPGKTVVKEFTPQTPGKYKFSCWMGMISGTIEVVSSN